MLDVPSPISLVFPEDHSIITGDTVMLAWRQGQRQVDRYWLEGDEDSLFTSPFVDSVLTDTSRIIGFLVHNQSYWWRVRAHNTMGWGDFSDAWTFLVYQDIPELPSLLEPSDGATGVSQSPLLVWSVSSGAESHGLQASDAPDFLTLLVNATGIDSTSFRLNDLQNGKTYYWRVNATNERGTTNWSDVWSFTTALTLPEKVILIQPDSAQVMGTDSIQFLWHKAEPEADRYWLEYDEGAGFRTPVIDSMITDTTALVQVINDETYNWRVRAHNSTGWGSFSNIWTFTVFVEDVEAGERIPVDFSLSQNYPNPFNPNTTITYGLPKRSQVRLEVFSLLGEKVALLVSQEKHPGYHNVVFDGHDLASGVYIYRITARHTEGLAGAFVDTKKLVLLR